MFNENKLDPRIESILNSLEGIEKAQPGPFFYTRLYARLTRAERNVWEKISYFVSRPAVAFAMVSMVIVLNMTVIMNQAQPAAPADQTYQSVYEDFTLASNDFYDYETKEP